MSSSKKTPASVRHGGPGASHENAEKPAQTEKGQADNDQRARSRVSGGGGEKDSHHTHAPEKKGGGSHPAHQND